jgi:hypothetical protein
MPKPRLNIKQSVACAGLRLKPRHPPSAFIAKPARGRVSLATPGAAQALISQLLPHARQNARQKRKMLSNYASDEFVLIRLH